MAGEETEGTQGRKEEEERGGKKRRGRGVHSGRENGRENVKKQRASIKPKAECAAGGERKTD